MYKVIVFSESNFSQIETELNALDGWNIIHIWSSSGRLGFLLKQDIEKRGRAKKDSVGE